MSYPKAFFTFTIILMIVFVPFRLNPERIGGDFKQEVQVSNLFVDDMER